MHSFRFPWAVLFFRAFECCDQVRETYISVNSECLKRIKCVVLTAQITCSIFNHTHSMTCNWIWYWSYEVVALTVRTLRMINRYGKLMTLNGTSRDRVQKKTCEKRIQGAHLTPHRNFIRFIDLKTSKRVLLAFVDLLFWPWFSESCLVLFMWSLLYLFWRVLTLCHFKHKWHTYQRELPAQLYK